MTAGAFVLADPTRCIGCQSCEIACAVAHLGTSVTVAGEMEVPFQPRLHVVRTSQVTMPIQCRHCEDAPCANACPAGAIVRQDGVVLVKQEKCIGCKTCVLACPFGAMDVVPALEAGVRVQQPGLKVQAAEGAAPKDRYVAHKCDLCIGRPGGPACVEVCLARALVIVQRTRLNQRVRARRAASAAGIARSAVQPVAGRREP